MADLPNTYHTSGKSLTDFRDRQRTTPDWIIPGLLKRGNTGFMIGPPKKAAKSWMVLMMAWDLAEGKPVWGIKKSDGTYLFQPSRPMRTVYFSQEDTEDDIQDRIYPNLAVGREPNDRLWVVSKNWNLKLDTNEGRKAVQEELDAIREKAGAIDLVAFDPMRRLHNGEENDSGAITKIWEVLNRIHLRYGCATLFTHHTRKPPEDKTFYDPTDPFIARGSGDIYGGGDAFMTVVPGKRTPAWQKIAMHFESKRGRPLLPAQFKVNLPLGETGKFEEGVKENVEWLGVGFEEERSQRGREVAL